MFLVGQSQERWLVKTERWVMNGTAFLWEQSLSLGCPFLALSLRNPFWATSFIAEWPLETVTKGFETGMHILCRDRPGVIGYVGSEVEARLDVISSGGIWRKDKVEPPTFWSLSYLGDDTGTNEKSSFEQWHCLCLSPWKLGSMLPFRKQCAEWLGERLPTMLRSSLCQTVELAGPGLHHL